MYGESESPQPRGECGDQEGKPQVDGVPEPSVWTPDNATEPADPPAAHSAGVEATAASENNGIELTSSSEAADDKAGLSADLDTGGARPQEGAQKSGGAENRNDRL